MALQLLRHCSSCCRMVFSIRPAPPGFYGEALNTFDVQVRSCFEQYTCLLSDDEQWTQATSHSSCFELCKDLDPAHTIQPGEGTDPAPERLALDAFNNSVNDDARLPYGSGEKLSQKSLSAAIDERTCAQLTDLSVLTLAL